MNLQRFLNQPIEVLLASKDLVLKEHYDNINLYAFDLNSDYYTMSSGLLQVTLNENKQINLLTLFFASLVTDTFFSAFQEFFGLPYQILKKDQILKQTNAVDNSNNGFHQQLSKTTYNFKSVSLTESPDFVFWKYKNYEIQLWLNYAYNTSKIFFKL